MCELTSLRLDDFSDTVTHILTIFWGESLVFFWGGGESFYPSNTGPR